MYFRSFNFCNAFKNFEMKCFEENKHKFDLSLMFNNSVQAVYPPVLIKKSVFKTGNNLNICGTSFLINKNCYVVGFGKAVIGMAAEMEKILGAHLVEGIVSVPRGIKEALKHHPEMIPNANSVLKIFEGAENNLPDDMSFEAAKQIKDLVSKLNDKCLLLVLISGGGSALLPFPKPPIKLQEKREVIKLLTERGADIIELNSVRKRLSVLKGGGLAKLAFPSQVVSLILSDIVGDDLQFISSGPTVPNNDPLDIVKCIIEKYNLLELVPKTLKGFYNNHSEANTDYIDNSGTKFIHVQNFIIGNNLVAIKSCQEVAQKQGYHTLRFSDRVVGNVKDIAIMYSKLCFNLCKIMCGDRNDIEPNLIKEIKSKFLVNENFDKEIKRLVHNQIHRVCLTAGGETTVVVKGKGVGGRNQELALLFANLMHRMQNENEFIKGFKVILMSVGTDGIDGPTNAAGAFGYPEQIEDAKAKGIDCNFYLSNNDSYNFFKDLNNNQDLILSGHTGTNVMDIHCLIVEKRPHCFKNGQINKNLETSKL